MRFRRSSVLLLLALAVGGAACDGPEPHARAADPPRARVDPVVAERRALDTLTRLGARDFVADSLITTGDTLAVWTGPRVWLATDRPMTVVRFLPPARLISIQHIPGG